MLYDAHDVPEVVFLFYGEEVLIYSVAVGTMNLDAKMKQITLSHTLSRWNDFFSWYTLIDHK